MLEENSRLKSKEAELRSEHDSLGKRLAEVEAGMAAAEDAKSVAETELMTLKAKSETTLADLHRRLEAQSTAIKNGENEAKQFDLKMSEMVNEKLALEEQLKDALSKNDNMAKDLKRLEEGRDSFDLIKASLEMEKSKLIADLERREKEAQEAAEAAETEAAKRRNGESM